MQGNRLTEKATLRKEIREYIQQQIAQGRFKAGDRIVETQMAKELGSPRPRCGRPFWNWPPWACWRSGPTPGPSSGS